MEPTYLEKSTMTTSRRDLNDNALASHLQMYFNNNMVQTHANFHPSNVKQEFGYDNFFECSTPFNNKTQNSKPVNSSSSCEYCIHSFNIGHSIKCPFVPPNSNENDHRYLDPNFTILQNLATHIQAHANEIIHYKCGHCKLNFKEKLDFVDHMRRHTSDCQTNGLFVQSPQLESEVISSKSTFLCTVCNASFSMKSHLQAHMKTHTSGQHIKQKKDVGTSIYINVKPNYENDVKIEKPFCCNICGLSYTRRTNLHAHQKIHTNGKPQPFVCTICNASYSRRTNLNSHLKSHTTGKVSYRCNFCSVSYSRKTNLNIHLRTHTGEKPYKCRQCEECFSRRSDLKTHSKIHNIVIQQHTNVQPVPQQQQAHISVAIQTVPQAANNPNNILSKQGYNYDLLR